MAFHHHHGRQVAHAFRLVGIVNPQFGFNVTLERKIVRDDAHEMITADRRFPKALDQLGIALDEGLARHRHPVRPSIGFCLFIKIVKLVKALLKQHGHPRILHDRRVGLAALKRLPGFPIEPYR